MLPALQRDCVNAARRDSPELLDRFTAPSIRISGSSAGTETVFMRMVLDQLSVVIGDVQHGNTKLCVRSGIAAFDPIECILRGECGEHAVRVSNESLGTPMRLLLLCKIRPCRPVTSRRLLVPPTRWKPKGRIGARTDRTTRTRSPQTGERGAPAAPPPTHDSVRLYVRFLSRTTAPRLRWICVRDIHHELTVTPLFGNDIDDGFRHVPAVAVEVLSVVLALAIGLILRFSQDDGSALTGALAVTVGIFDTNLHDVGMVGQRISFGEWSGSPQRLSSGCGECRSGDGW